MLQRNLVTSLVLYESVRTTRKRARVIQPIIDHLITVTKTKSVREAIRMLNTVVTHENASKKLMEVLKARYASRPSGYSRVIPVGARKGDGAELVDLELLDQDTAPAAEEASAKKKTTSAK